MKNFLTKIAFLLFGCALMLFFIPGLYDYAQNDLVRFKTIKDKISEIRPENHNLYFLGNSVVMCGINGNLIADSLHLSPGNIDSLFNFSSPGQNILESIVIADQINTGNSIYGFGFTINDLFNDTIIIEHSKKLAFYNYNFTPRDETLDYLSQQFDPQLAEIYDAPFFINSFASRGIVLTSFNSLIRNVIRKGSLNMKRAYTDLKYPMPYTDKVPDEKLSVLLSKKYAGVTRKNSAIPEKNVQLLNWITAHFRNKGDRIFFYILPDHPYLQNLSGSDYYDKLDEQLKNISGSNSVPIFNFSLLFRDKTFFIDHTHNTREAAEILSNEMYYKLRNSGVLD